MRAPPRPMRPLEELEPMDHDSGDIDAYFARIGYAGPREPTLAVLQAIVAGHTFDDPV